MDQIRAPRKPINDEMFYCELDKREFRISRKKQKMIIFRNIIIMVVLSGYKINTYPNYICLKNMMKY